MTSPAHRPPTGVHRVRWSRRWAAWSVALALSLGACRLPYVPPFTSPPPAAVAHLATPEGKVIGNAVMIQHGSKVRILLDVLGATAGVRAVHIHEVGHCEGPSFASAGAHFNPKEAQHGRANRQGPHAGDLPSITIDSTGRGHLEFTADVTIDKGSRSLFGPKGTALVMHEMADDNMTDPDGRSGPRIACGVIIRAQ